MNEILSPEQVKAARALLAWSQQELAAEARVATSTVADFERGVRTPMINNAQAIRESLEARGLEFIAGGVVEKAMLPPPPPVPHPGSLFRWVNATDLSQWGERRDGQSGMPELLRRLIYAAHGPAAFVHFPSDESVQYRGWDGVCTVIAGSEFVPDGDSVWEIGAQRTRIRKKAGDDLDKRTEDPMGHDRSRTTFVFVTPQRFVGKEEWVAEKKSLGIWRDIVAIDGDDLVHWLEMYPAVAQWLSVKIGRRPQGLRNMDEVWEEWVRTTKVPLTPDVLLTDRDGNQIAVLKWLREAPQLISIQADAPDEAIAFLHAAISPLPEAYRLSYLSRCVVTDTDETARQLLGLGTPLIIVMTDPDAGLARRLVDAGHHVFAAYGPSINDSANACRLARPWRFHLQAALTQAGLSEEHAHLIARASGRSITVLRRLMPAAPNYRTRWAERAPAELIAAMFAGAWMDTNGPDRKLISKLAGCSYEQFETVLAPLAAGLDGPIVRLGNIWKVVSLRDLWTQIGAQVTPTQFARFEAAYQEVLSTINPRFATRPKGKYYEEEGEFGEEISSTLRQGLAEAMIAPAVYPNQAALITDVVGRVGGAVHKLLHNAPAALWWSLSRDFHNIAEAAPDAFLDALEVGLEGSDPAVMSLFRSDEGVFHSAEYLSNLLWALEMLARSPNYVMRAALLLAHLDELDPGGKWGNRPSATLRRIFVTWSPQTYATPAQRLKVIDRVVREYPDVGWNLLMALAPKFHDTSGPSSMPNWRDFAPDEPELITWSTVAEASRAVGKRLLAQVGGSIERWQSLLDLWGNFDSAWRVDAAVQLERFVADLSEPGEIEVLRDKLRGLLEKHRGFKDAQWALAEEDLQPLDQVFNNLQPVGVEDRVRWLFRPGAMNLRPNVDFKAQHDELEARQIQAAEALLADLSEDALFAFTATITMHNALGVAVAMSHTPEATQRTLLKRGLLADDAGEADFASGIMWGLKMKAGARGDAWIHQLWAQAIAENWGERAEIRIVHALPPAPETWAEIESRSVSLVNAYWKTLSAYVIPGDADPVYIAEHLSAADRSRDAIGWLGHNIAAKPPGPLLVQTLRKAAQSAAPTDSNNAVMLSYSLGIILEYLETIPEVTEQEIVELEWSYFQSLRYSQRPARTLHRALARDPDFYVYMLKLIFLPAKDSGVEEPEPEDIDGARQLATQAYDVLHDWALVPGTDDQGVIDLAALEDWIKRARKLLAEAGRGEIGDSKIGEILSAAKREPDQPWPPKPVREIIEMVRSRAMERGFEVGVYNRRGVTVRMPHDGGELERSLAARYRADAEALRFDWLRTAGCLDRIASTYEVDAKREDLSADQRDWL
ncbi:XRE family transcriptional regulator [Acidithiobacillus thiooxidans]|uniref:XRE family transcriptional regulator n=3 Tax=Acidithiobacillus thiooxidans TaxID=930 RepID=A0A1C2I065_ACITH|nr:helix-turn-helix transcriptional regulator [Acidithiobacillus thiooxidans]OCX69330.1 XRE family transcriptional regulator [Acidithiobacillus thiooxidans]OCX77510.1 XRE family transcriptional regulator [Acidithiobacillus thiooxidans]OCX81414.1 XRE family transcriptional regulator [Acidithiobacillus thiooxidans]OFC42513.1 XRE family transcriptional regulator [Acidithiobacillus thiooxidans]